MARKETTDEEMKGKEQKDEGMRGMDDVKGEVAKNEVVDSLGVGAAGSGLDDAQRQEGRGAQAPPPEPMHVDVAKVDRFAEDVYWEEVVDKDMEDKMILEVTAEMNEMNLGDISEFIEGWAWDDVKNKHLDVSKVQEERLEEVGYMIRKGVWKEVDVSEC